MTQYLMIGGTQLALPDYARTDLAYTFSRTWATVPAGSALSYVAAGDKIEIAFSVFAVFVTDGTAGNRVVMLEIDDNNGGVITQVPAAAAHAPGTSASYNFSVTLPYTYGPVGSKLQTGFPAVPMMAGWTLFLEAQNLVAGDQFKNVTITTMRVPTGPPRFALPAAPPTPVLV